MFGLSLEQLCLSSLSPDVHLDMVLLERCKCDASLKWSALALEVLPEIVMPELDNSV